MTTRTTTPDEQSYYWSGGEKIPLEPEPGAIAVKFEDPDGGGDLTRLSRRHRQLLRNRSRRGRFVEGYGLQIYHADESALGPKGTEGSERALRRRTLEIIRDLNEDDGVEYVTPVYRRSPGSGDHVFVTNRFVAGFKPEVAAEPGRIEAFNDENDVEMLETVGYADNAYVLRAPKSVGSVAMANRYYESGLVTFANPDLVHDVRRRSHRVYELARELGYSNEEMLGHLDEIGVEATSHLSAVDTTEERRLRDYLHEGGANPRTHASGGTTTTGEDGSMLAVERSPGGGETTAELAERTEFLGRQWHLRKARVTDAWELTRGDSDITVAIMDDGIDLEHPEFQGKVVGQYDFMLDRPDGRPKDWEDNHGTACAGVAVGAGVKAAGAAPECSVLAIRFPGTLGSVEEAEMFRWAADNGADVVSCSWGPADNEGAAPIPDNVSHAITHCATRGRGGKGCPIFWAAGNGGESVMDDGWATHPDVITVGASTSEDTYATYSDFGSKISVVAPSSGDWDQGTEYVFTTDRSGLFGYNSGDAALGDQAGDYTDEFGGTSSAAPLAAGVGALVLSANPDLEAKQVRSILESTAAEIGQEPYVGGRNDRFGHGRIDARAAVEASGDGGTVTTQEASVSGPSSVSRAGGPPTFTVSLGPWDRYAVELVSEVELFDEDAHGPRRNDSNFYNTWQDIGPLTDGQFRLPQHAWDRLKHADRLFYRGLFIDDASSTTHRTVADDEASAAGATTRVPSIDVTGQGEPTEPTEPTPTGEWPELRSGQQGRDVTTLQYLLSEDGFWLDVDGIYGPGTQDVVERFQSQEGIAVTGVVGADTWRALVPTLRRGDFGEAVRGLQTQLRVAVDGDFGPATASAVESFQSSAGLTVDGIAGPNTWGALLRR
jgi:subtilisin family serine protease